VNRELFRVCNRINYLKIFYNSLKTSLKRQVILAQSLSACKKTIIAAPKKNRGKLLCSSLKQSFRSSFCRVFLFKKHTRGSCFSAIASLALVAFLLSSGKIYVFLPGLLRLGIEVFRGRASSRYGYKNIF